MTFFAGKDLLWAMDGSLRNNGFGSAGAFREKILVGISKADAEVWKWLPEWEELRRAVENS